MTTSLSIIPACDTVVKPKPTKREIIEAMARVQIEKLTKERNENRQKRELLALKLNNKLRSAVKKTAMTMEARHNFGYSDLSWIEMKFTFKKEELSAELLAMLQEWHDLKDFSIPSLKDAMKQIQARMEQLTPPQKRVDELLANKAARAAIEASLDALQ